jgi:transposase
MRAALNELATVAPEWLRLRALPEWFERYSTRAEQSRLPVGEKAKTEFAAKVGRDGFLLLELIEAEKSGNDITRAMKMARLTGEKHQK